MSQRKQLLFDGVDYNARHYPGNPAFQYRDDTLSYADLAQQSNRLAHALLLLGVKKGDRVGIFCKQSLQVPVAVFGIQKAGAAYVPIDPQIPVTRLQNIILDLDINILITHSDKEDILRDLCTLNSDDKFFPLNALIGVSSILAEGIRSLSWQEVETNSDSDPDVKIESQDLAYIITTSGSTGTPKGIMHTHYSGLSYAKLSSRSYAVTREDSLGNFVPLHFDISTFAYFVGPLTGASVVLVPEECLLFPASLVDYVASKSISIWYSAPFPLIQIAQNKLFQGHNLEKLRWVKYGGESMHAKYLRLLMQQLPQARFSNSYGPAEVNQCTFYHFPGPPVSDDPLPIGQTWDENDCLILNDADEPVCSGEEGELLVHSPTMMLGYWNRPEMNRKAFYSQHKIGEGGKLFYRTGDLVSTNQDGLLIFAGRKDRQVKIRGYRVELDEIEAILVSRAEVSEAVALVVKDSNGNARIATQVTLNVKMAISEKELISHCRISLPSYAIPFSVDFVDEFPRTSSGKIHRLEIANKIGGKQ